MTLNLEKKILKQNFSMNLTSRGRKTGSRSQIFKPDPKYDFEEFEIFNKKGSRNKGILFHYPAMFVYVI